MSLTVYKASAGSGKTFTLATEYIKLLINKPDAYKNILAVTFTNKATEEMKLRILSQLYGISKRLPSSQRYYEAVKKAFPAESEDFVRHNAGVALNLLLHDYNYFRVETIDSFFQNVVRNLARELDLTPNLRVGLNDKQTEEQAVDDMIDGLADDRDVRSHIVRYAHEKIKEDKNWNVIKQIKDFGEKIFQDAYRAKSKQLMEKMGEKDFFENFAKRLEHERATAKQTMDGYQQRFFKILEDNALTVYDFSNNTRGVCGFFLKIKDGDITPGIINATALNCADDPEKWVAKNKNGRESILDIVSSRLRPLLVEAIDAVPGCWHRYKSAQITLAHLYQLRLLGNIEEKVSELNRLHERFLLSNTQYLLAEFIKDTDSPFVFEKIGAYLEHIMIDEFQDTGTKQWRNFKVLLKNCMDAGTSNLIVGDVKQSIYRWRSGDWTILNDITREFGREGASMVDVCTLATNYRSCENIIAFNNAFFRAAINVECSAYPPEYAADAEQLRAAYSDVVQLCPEKKNEGGYVSVTLFPNTRECQEQTMNRLVDIVDDLLGRGIDKSKIAILVRSNKHIPMIADYFSIIRPEVKIVSDEAFQLSSSPAVNIIVAAMRLIAHPHDDLTKATLVNLYRHEVLGCADALNDALMEEGVTLDDMLPSDMQEVAKHTAHLSLCDVAGWIYKTFNLQKIKGQTEYLCAFFDQLSKFADDAIPTIRAFVEAWDDDLYKKTIQDSAVDGIRIVSIHKSKGLEFDHVLLPFCDWKLEITGSVIWAEAEDAPYNELPLIPVDYSEKGLMGTTFEKAYRQEHHQNTVDNLNMLYVAFTRAKKSLYVIGRKGDKSRRSSVIEACLPIVANELGGVSMNGDDDKKEPTEFSWGEPYAEIVRNDSVSAANECRGTNSGQSESESNVFLQSPTTITTGMAMFDDRVKFRQSNAARAFVESTSDADSGDADEVRSGEDNNYIKVGTVLHKVFSTIRTTADIDTALAQLQFDGVLPDGKSVEKMKEMLRMRLTNKRVADWFSGRWTLFNECSILYIDDQGSVRDCRPDRVMTDGRETIVVDYKFGRPEEEYKEQVRGYMNHLQTMGMPGVKGYLWYVYSNRIEEV